MTAAPGPAAPDIGAVRDGEALDLDAVLGWLRGAAPGLSGPPRLAQFHGGYANLTYALTIGDAALVLRRPPLGPVPKGAHDMAREHRVLSALAPCFARAPRAVAFCDDLSVIGAPFLVMERRPGVVVRRAFPPELAAAPAVERRCAFALMDALADLHRLDPGAVGLGDLGRPDGFAARQVDGWTRRGRAALTPPSPLFEAVAARLAAGVPAPRRVSVLHNDPKLDNCLFAPGAPDAVTTMLDWDMATIGDPLVDLGVCLAYFAADRGAWGGMFSAATVAGDYPAQAELADRYNARAGWGGGDVAWATAFGLWKNAVVLAQIHARWRAGQTADPRFAGLGRRAADLIEKAAATLDGAPADEGAREG